MELSDLKKIHAFYNDIPAGSVLSACASVKLTKMLFETLFLFL